MSETLVTSPTENITAPQVKPDYLKTEKEPKYINIQAAAKQSGRLGVKVDTANPLSHIAPHSMISDVKPLLSRSLVHLLDRNLNRYMESALKFSGLIILVGRNKNLADLLNGWLDSYKIRSQETLNQIDVDLSELIEIESHKASRMNYVQERAPDVFKFTFSHPFFWMFLDMLQTADDVLSKIDSMRLADILSNSDATEKSDEIITFVKRSFKTLDLLNIKADKRRGKNENLSTEDFTNILKNFDTHVLNIK
ncbi:hypothetical protein EIJ81_00515 (plasmid) [Aliivibrio salmonicida]|uniref:hypothetical protein n=1 Tax=Aliivibrio salmonicida TaxID=40269 RepID=UPI000F6F07F1|nr:hypothetical protein [Aliivibrio salmonicida]AZL83382.1 hypothetical protein EIJ81_00515 [Aliivibrio salmonicida]